MAEILADKDYLENGLKKICDGIRKKGGSMAQLAFPDAIEAAVESISGNEIEHAEIPEYVKTAALDVAEKVRALQTGKTITFLAITDSHHAGAQTGNWQENTNIGNLHAAMAAKILAYAIKFDFMAYLGDATFGNGDTTKPMLISQIEDINRMTDEAYRGIPQFRTVGNHDTGEYRFRTTKNPDDLTGAAELFRLIGSYCEGAVYGSTEFGYCYRDFEAKKLRVICLNTCEGETLAGEDASPTISQEQLLWFANRLREVNDKPQAAGWSIITLAHYPLDYGSTSEAARIVKCYVEGLSWGGVDFAGHNAAKYVCHFHGHTHCFKTSKMYDYYDGAPAQFDAWRVAIPNAGFYRENQYYGHPVRGVDFGEPQSYPKTAKTAEDTSFTIQVVDPEKQVVNSIHYGAGYDRVIGYSKTIYYSIQSGLENAELSNKAISVEKGQPFHSDIVLQPTYTVDSITILMGGADITQSAYQGGKIAIPAVTGNVSIRIVAKKPVSYHNLVPTSIDASGGIYNGTGYKNGFRINSSGNEEEWTDDLTATGFIKVPNLPYTIRVGGTATGSYKDYGVRFAFYDKDFAYLSTTEGKMIGSSQWFGTVVEEATTVLTWMCDDSTNGPKVPGAVYMRLSFVTGGRGDGLIVTIDETIEE